MDRYDTFSVSCLPISIVCVTSSVDYPKSTYPQPVTADHCRLPEDKLLFDFLTNKSVFSIP